ncbi:flagellar motor switch protein FliY [Campylobacter sp. LH-2024]|uniref:Flagellar motor switch protein FliY n=1 Tax=Campylobacter molothri TaxID=1032242 RepID=A0ACC5VZN7_9BACT|nr:flagellar motor switch protein FliY [Campylobacter sp. RM10537]MBZ7928069.1 flagellar motor switch protein FliY [Campylobacter sp. RM10542]MBZ7929706.1 flagellar motor switch protein FliY [Campylobacter sp. W0067]MBZ7932281.1 flagellar motor switch protein FliY [Campylobacter sp. RM10543]MBZ7940096.1 flagellar motor switch protein FliY [Campylobacter sp. W0047]MBZ7943553.1 flagellar motor switch protein FliY [Campylobacter sp. RM13744]MBZ7944835.1 flagellar motor switch protein FliY [Campy
MINDFLKLFTNECISTIEGLTGKSAEFSEYKEFDVSSQDTLKPPLVFAIFNVNDNAKIGILASSILMSAIGEWMMGEEEISKNDQLGPDEMDAAKEAIQNIISAFSTTLGAQKEIPNMDFSISSCDFVSDSVDFKDFVKLYFFDVKIQDLEEQISLVMDQNLYNILSGKSDEANSQNNTQSNEERHFNISEELKNINLIMDVRLPVRVRIGNKKMLLKDVLTMDIGSVVELNQLANDPLEILIGEKRVAYGEVVIVDGNFGVQITEIGSKKERLEQLR